MPTSRTAHFQTPHKLKHNTGKQTGRPVDMQTHTGMWFGQTLHSNAFVISIADKI